MKRIYLGLALAISFCAHAKKLSEYTPFEYKVLFTNPECKTYYYDDAIATNSGDFVSSKPKNVYCKPSDSRKTAYKERSPHKQILNIINDVETKEIFLTYLSFSKASVAKALCKAIEDRNLKVTFIIDEQNKKRDADGALANFKKVKYCRAKNVSRSNRNIPKMLFRGGTGSLGYAHNKIIIANPKDTNKVKIVFGSGNMSSGTTLHHENWHFVTTSPQSHFAQMHLCIMNGMINDGSSKREYTDSIAKCKSKIATTEEEDIKVYVIPGDGTPAMNHIKRNLKKANSTYLAAHRFSNGKLISALHSELGKGKEIKLVCDDDLYWTGTLRRSVGRNTYQEYRKVMDLVGKGMEVHYMQTNQDANLLHHNKFLIFNYADNKGSVFTGAGNLTTAAFTKNFENFYMIDIPQVYESFTKQYDYLFNKLATGKENMPSELKMP